MPAVRPLRRILFIRFALVAVVPFLIASLLGLAWFFPRLRAEVSRRQELLAATFVDEIDIYVRKARVTAASVAALPPESFADLEMLQAYLDAQVRSSETIRSLYLAGADGRIAAAGLKPGDALRRPDLLGIDITGTPLWGELQRTQRPSWSDLYLSLIGGGLTVAVAEPLANGGIVVAEVDLERLSGFLSSIARSGEQTVLILDRRGQLIADQNGRFTAQQLSLRNIPFVRALVDADSNGVGELDYDGVAMIGCLQHVPEVRWHVLAAQPITLAYRPLRLTVQVVAVSLLVAVLVGLVTAGNVARRLAIRFEILAGHARRVASGTAGEDWPPANIREFQELAADLRQMDAAIRERERQLTTLMGNLPGMVYRAEPAADGVLIFASSGAHALTGYVSTGLENCRVRCYAELVHPDDREAVATQVHTALQNGSPYQAVYRITAAGGEVKWVWDLGQGVFDAHGHLLAREGFVTEITDRIRAEEALRGALRDAEAASRAKSDFLANMSHELRTPLNGVLGMLQLLEQATELSADQAEFVQLASASGWSLLHLLNDLLDLSRIEAGQMTVQEEPTDVAALLHSVVEVFRRPAAEKQVELLVDCGAGLPPGLGIDPTRLRQILFNLVGNAVKFTPRGTVRVWCAALAGGAGRGRLLLEVSDTGIGMSEDLQQRIFQPFVQGEEFYRRSYQGAGLGLSIVKRLVEMMHGSVAVTSQPGAGTTMRVELEVGWPPGADPDEEEPMQGESGGTTDKRGLRILLAEDSRTNQMALRLMLEKEGHRVVVVENGRQVLDLLRQQPFDLVLMDIQMPEMDGLEATRLIRQEQGGAFDPRIPVVAITAYAMVGDREKFLDAGADDYLAKPVMWDDLRAVITRWS